MEHRDGHVVSAGHRHRLRPSTPALEYGTGVVALRRRPRKMVDDVEAGRDPETVERGEAEPRSTKAGIFTVDTRKTASPAAGF